jgi:hypothetical protein
MHDSVDLGRGTHTREVRDKARLSIEQRLAMQDEWTRTRGQ